MITTHPPEYDAVQKASSHVIDMHENLSCVICHCGITIKCCPVSSQQGFSSSPAVKQGDPRQAFGLALDASCLLRYTWCQSNTAPERPEGDAWRLLVFAVEEGYTPQGRAGQLWPCPPMWLREEFKCWCKPLCLASPGDQNSDMSLWPQTKSPSGSKSCLSSEHTLVTLTSRGV